MSERLFRYDPSELRAAGERLVEESARLERFAALTADPEVFTELVLDWLAAAAPERARVDAIPARRHLTAALYEELSWAAPRVTSRRGLVDLAHLAHPRFEVGGTPYGYAYWRAAIAEERLELLLAAQLEWGGGGRAAGRFGRVMLAAADLASVDARAKALIVATDDEAERRRLIESLTALRLASWDARPWLWVDLPLRVDRAAHPPAWGLLEG